jgi:hypothetical protein
MLEIEVTLAQARKNLEKVRVAKRAERKARDARLGTIIWEKTNGGFSWGRILSADEELMLKTFPKESVAADDDIRIISREDWVAQQERKRMRRDVEIISGADSAVDVRYSAKRQRMDRGMDGGVARGVDRGMDRGMDVGFQPGRIL